MKKSKRGYKKEVYLPPSFWCKSRDGNKVVVYTDYKNYDIVAIFKYDNKDKPIKKEIREVLLGGMLIKYEVTPASIAIEKAEKLISDLIAGRVNVKDLIKKLEV